ncbi:MAG: hypothetical protein WBU20_08165 [Candidatus Acidiferrum sp.]
MGALLVVAAPQSVDPELVMPVAVAAAQVQQYVGEPQRVRWVQAQQVV